MLREIDKYVNTTNLLRKGNEMSVIAMKKVLEDEDICMIFFEVDKTSTYLKLATNKILFRAIQRRVMNSRVKAILKRYMERNTGNYTKHGADTSLRGEFKVKATDVSVVIVSKELRSPRFNKQALRH